LEKNNQGQTLDKDATDRAGRYEKTPKEGGGIRDKKPAQTVKVVQCNRAGVRCDN